MAVEEYRRDGTAAAALRRFRRAGPALLTAALVFVGLVQVAGLGVGPALVGFAAVALAALMRELSLGSSSEAPPDAGRLMPALVDRAVESDLPDPTIVLTLESIVVAFNDRVQELTPGILRGEPISFALRVPNVLEAIRTVAASRQMRRTEFFQRVPTDRWWEATIAPLVLPGGASPDRHLVLLALRDLTP